MSKKFTNIEEYFWSNVDKRGPDECWPWKGREKGYGQARFGGQAISAYRLAYILEKGEVPEGMVVCHSCDNPPCCNPAHLWVGTHSENTLDMVKKGRWDWTNKEKAKGNIPETQPPANFPNGVADPLTVTKAALELGMNQHTLKLLCAAGEVPGAIKPGHDWLIPRESLSLIPKRKRGRQWKVKPAE